MSLITAWSYSRYSYYIECPYKLHISAIQKIKTEPSWPLIRGKELHKLCENYLNGTITGGVPQKLQAFEHELKTIKRLKAKPEVDFSVTKKWLPSFGTDWDNVWCRSYLDAVLHAKLVLTIIDYKTGKIYTEAHMKQAHLYATCGFAHYPDVETINVEFWYFDQDETLQLTFYRKDWDQMKKKWERRVKPMLSDKELLPCPDADCKRCFFNPKKGGTCEHAE